MKNNNSLIFLITFLFLFILNSCQKNKKVETTAGLQTPHDTLNLPNEVTFKCVTDDPNALNYLNFINYSYLTGSNHQKIDKTVINDTLIIDLQSINEPQIIELFSFGDSFNYNTRLFVTPGDTILLSIKNKKIKFIGKNKANYNFFIALDSMNTEWAKNKYYHGKVKDYKRQCEKIYERRLNFFNNYSVSNEVSNNFKTIVSAELKFEYLYNLIAPRDISSDTNLNINNQGDFISTIAQNYDVEKNGFLNLEDYFDNVKVKDFDRPELINNDFFKRSLSLFIQNYFARSKYPNNYSKENFITERDFIQKNFSGDIEYYAIAKMISDYSAHGFGYSLDNIGILKNTILEYDSIFSLKPTYEAKMSQIKKSLNNFNFKLPNDIAATTQLINPTGDTLKLNEILKTIPSNKIKVFDFWASWCSPCIKEMKETKRLKEELSNKNVEWIYLSIDNDMKKWLKKSNELQKYLNTKNQYFIVKGNKSSLIKYLNVNSIPRYIIFNSNEQVVLENAPRPSDSLVFKKIIEKIN